MGDRLPEGGGCMQPQSLRIRLAVLRTKWCDTYVMPIFGLLLLGSFIVGTLAAGKTQSVAKMMGWGVVALLPLTLCLVYANIFVGTDWQNIQSTLGMGCVALVLHVAVSAFCRFAFLAEKSDS